jgi:hypothetical protein
MTGAKKLVIGASGFLGSAMRCAAAATSSTVSSTEGRGCATPRPLFRTDVEGLRHVLDAAVDADLRRFAFNSTIGTIGIPAGPPSSFRRIDSAAKTSSGLRMHSSDIGFKINVWPKNSR